MLLFTDKYSPKNLSGFIGNSEVVSSAIAWARLWEEGKREIPLLLWGATGTGKTCLAHLIAALNGWTVFEMNASDIRTKDAVETIAGAASQNTSFTGKHRLVLLDEIDGLSSGDRGAAGAIVSLINESRNPIIFTADDIYSDKKLAPVRALCKTLEFKRINYLSIANHLEKICEAEKVGFDKEALKELARGCGGDMRAAMLDLQSLSLGGEEVTLDAVKSLSEREREEKVFEIMKHVFRAQSFSEARESVSSSEVSKDLLFRWIEENIPRQYSGNEISDAFYYLGKADLYNNRIMRRQNYSFLKFYYDFMSGGVALARKEKNPSFVPYQFPKLLTMLSRSSIRRAMLSSVANKMKEKGHDSAKQIIAEDIPYVREMLANRDYAVGFSAFYGFDEKDLSFLTGRKADSREMKEIMAEAQGIRERMIAKKQGLFSLKGEPTFVRTPEISFEEEPEEKSEEPVPIDMQKKSRRDDEPEDRGKQTKLF